jgi:chemotaxis methyl-accepting protein methylase
MAHKRQDHMGQAVTDDDNEFAALLDKIRAEHGFDARQYKETFLKRRLAIRLRERQTSGYREYMRVLERDPREFANLMAALSINLTRFFRDPGAFAALRDKLLAPLLRQRADAGARYIRLWSAGCATGEEAYSLAILLLEHLGAQAPDWRIELLASDVDEAALARARAARYNVFSVHNLAPHLRERYTQGAGAEVQLAPAVTRLVRFQRHDLLRTPYPQGLDVILCRNVMIYFSREQQERLFRRLQRALAPGGGLLIGRVEILPPSMREHFDPLDLREHLYVARGNARTASRVEDATDDGSKRKRA